MVFEAPTVGWSALHASWQALLIWGTVGFLHMPLRRSRASAAQAVAWIGFGTAVILTVLAVAVNNPAGVLFPEPAILHNGRSDLIPLANFTWPHWFRPLGILVPFFFGAWVVGVSMFIGYMVLSFWTVTRLVRGGRELDVACVPSWSQLVDRLTPGLSVRLIGTKAIRSPGTVGWRQSVIVMPECCIEQLSAGDLDAIVAHELAHIRRNDYLVNLCQLLVESLLFFNLGILLLGRTIRHRRESLCDELAVEALGVSYESYIKSIYLVGKLRRAPMALAANGGSLLERFRYLRSVESLQRSARWLLPAVCTAIITMATLGAASTSAVRKIEVLQTVDSFDRSDFGATVLDVLAVQERANPEFVRHIGQAVKEVANGGTLRRETAEAIMRDVRAGVTHDELLRAADAHARSAADDWRRWQRVARALYDVALSLPEQDGRSCMRAALAVASQESLRCGTGYARWLASDERCLVLTKLSALERGRLWMAVSVKERDFQQSMAIFARWTNGQPDDIPADLRTAMQTRPFLAWQVILEIRRVERLDPFRGRILSKAISKAELPAVMAAWR